MSEPTLHERLMEVSTPFAFSPQKWSYGQVKESDLAAIQTAIEDAATSPLRAEVERLKGRLDRATEFAQTSGKYALKTKGQYDALKARSDDLRDAVTLCVQCSSITGLPRALQDYDAADRAGDTQVKTSDLYNIVTDPTVPEGEVHFRDGDKTVGKIVGIGDAPSPTGAPMTREEWDAVSRAWETEDSPSPTDAAAEQEPLVGLAWVKSWIGDFGDGLRAHETRLDNLVARADAATSRLDMHMQRIEELQHWREAIAKSQTDSDADLDRRLAALEAAPTPVPVVTDAILDAFFDAYDHSGAKTRREATRDALAAALALAAGGAK